MLGNKIKDSFISHVHNSHQCLFLGWSWWLKTFFLESEKFRLSKTD